MGNKQEARAARDRYSTCLFFRRCLLLTITILGQGGCPCADSVPLICIDPSPLEIREAVVAKLPLEAALRADRLIHLVPTALNDLHAEVARNAVDGAGENAASMANILTQVVVEG